GFIPARRETWGGCNPPRSQAPYPVRRVSPALRQLPAACRRPLGQCKNRRPAGFIPARRETWGGCNPPRSQAPHPVRRVSPALRQLPAACRRHWANAKTAGRPDLSRPDARRRAGATRHARKRRTLSGGFHPPYGSSRPLAGAHWANANRRPAGFIPARRETWGGCNPPRSQTARRSGGFHPPYGRTPPLAGALLANANRPPAGFIPARRETYGGLQTAALANSAPARR